MAQLKQVIEKIKEFANGHGMINEVGVGSYYKIDTTTRKYPLMWITPTPSTIVKTSIRLNFDIMFADILDGEESNLVDVWSDQLQNACDFVSYFATDGGYEDFDLRLDESTVTIEPFMHLLDNECAGYFVRCTFVAPLALNPCANPIK
jgi:hypothetical protein